MDKKKHGSLDVKVVHPIAGVNLYFCPYCNKGHMLNFNQKVCDICGTTINWNLKRIVKNEINR